MRNSANPVISMVRPAVSILVVTLTLILVGATSHARQTNAESESAQSQVMPAGKETHMSESLRASIRNVVVVPGVSPANQELTGTYENETAGLIGGIDQGSRTGTISKDVGGIPVSIPIPILQIPGAIWGGISGATKRQIQEFRDALTEELVNASSQPLSSDKVALDVFWRLQAVPELDSKLFAPTTEIPAATDAILYIGVQSVGIDVQGKEAILTTAAVATLNRKSDGLKLYERVVHYQDRDTLENWTENDNALWRDYANYARHYLGRELSAEVYDRVKIKHEIRPLKTDDVDRVKRNDWLGATESVTPTLGWELSLSGGNSYGSWAEQIDMSNIFYDVEIYDAHQLVYAENRIPETQHTVAFELEDCRTYRWSVRPSYQVGTDIKYGEWMRSPPADGAKMDTEFGITGRQASVAPAYIQDFASLEVKCQR